MAQKRHCHWCGAVVVAQRSSKKYCDGSACRVAYKRWSDGLVGQWANPLGWVRKLVDVDTFHKRERVLFCLRVFMDKLEDIRQGLIEDQEAYCKEKGVHYGSYSQRLL